MGGEIAPRPGQCGTNPKTSEWERAGYEKGGAGVLPRDSLRPGFLWKKAGGKNTRAPPWTRVLWPLVATRWFRGCGAWFRWLGYFGAQVRALIWGLSFEEYFWGILGGM